MTQLMSDSNLVLWGFKAHAAPATLPPGVSRYQETFHWAGVEQERGSSQQEQSEGGIQELGMLGDMSTCWEEKTEAILCAQLSEKHLNL